MSRSWSGRILHVGKFYPPYRGGMETFLADLIEEQRQQGLDTIGLVHGQPEGDDPSWLHRVRVQAQILFAPVGLGFPLRLRRLIREFEPDVLHLHMPNNAVFWALFMVSARKVPWVVHWQSDVVNSNIRKALSVAYRIYEPFERLVLHQAAAIVATSPDYLDTSEPLRRWRAKCHVVPLGIRPPGASVAPAASAGRWQPGKFRLLSIGRLTYYKGFETLIRAVSGLPDAELIIVGEGALRQELAQLIRACTPAGREPNVRLIGSVDDDEKHQLLAACELFCLASRERTEAFGIVLLEAMQHGVPCLVADLAGSGMPWIVRTAGNGRLAPVEDVPAWQSSIRSLHANPALRQQLGLRGLKAAAAGFSISACADHISEVYSMVSEGVRENASRADLLVMVLVNQATSTALLRDFVERLKALRPVDVIAVSYADPDSAHAARPPAEAAAAGIPRIETPFVVTSSGAIQTGLRYALNEGYRGAISLPLLPGADVPQLLRVLSEELIAAAQDRSADVIIGTLGGQARLMQRLAWTWLKLFTPIQLQKPPTALRAYNRDAMLIATARSATLLDHEDLGALVVMAKSRLKLRELGLPEALGNQTPLDMVPRTWSQTVGYAVATVVLCLSNWKLAPRKPAS